MRAAACAKSSFRYPAPVLWNSLPVALEYIHILISLNGIEENAIVLLQVRDRAWFVRMYGEIIDRTVAQTMLYLTCTTISSVDLAQYGVSLAKDWVSVECGTRVFNV